MTSRALLLLLLVACGDPAVDLPEADGGQAPNPTGVMEGDVVFSAPRPPCVDGRVVGRVVLLLFRNDAPPAPEGPATSALNLLFIDGTELFEASDCALDEGTLVTRSAGFVWPEIALGPGDQGVIYQLRASYDTDGSFDPRFGIFTSPTRGDVAGGAFVSTLESPLRFRTIAFEGVAARPAGQRVTGVTVTLAAPVATELHAFTRGDGAQALDSRARFSLNPDPAMADQENWELARLRLRLLDPAGPEGPTLAAANLGLDLSPAGRGFFVAPVDLNRDGEGDLHPVLGSSGVPWLFPLVIAQRARNPVELAAGIPDVRLVATVRPGFVLPPAQRTTFAPEVDITVPPAAIVTLRPDLPQCEVPFLAPGNVAELYEAGPTECQELPTGSYDLIAIGGLAGARPVDVRAALRAAMPELSDAELDAQVAARTDTGFALEGGLFASQTWRVPNELGCPDVAYRPPGTAVNQIDEDPTTACGAPDTLQLTGQGPDGRFAVVDADAADAADPADTSDGRGVAACQMTARAATGMLDAVTYVDVPPECCDAVRPLCGLPLCPLMDRAPLAGAGAGARATRELRAEDLQDGVPTCVPFHMPVSCCRG